MKSDEPVLAMNGKRASPVGAYPIGVFFCSAVYL